MATAVEAVLRVSIGPELTGFSFDEIQATIDSALLGLARSGPGSMEDDHEGSWRSVALQWLEALPHPQNKAAEVAARNGGVISRAEVYRILGADERKRELRGFTRPFTRIAQDLIDQGLLNADIDPKDAVTAIYAGGSKTAGFRLNEELVEPLRAMLLSRG